MVVIPAADCQNPETDDVQTHSLPTDGSPLSLRAIDMGVALASELGARVYVLHVGDPFPAAVFLPELAQISEVTYTADVTAAAQRFIAIPVLVCH